MQVGDEIEYTHYHFYGHGRPRSEENRHGTIVKMTSTSIGILNSLKPYSSSNPIILYRRKN